MQTIWDSLGRILLHIPVLLSVLAVLAWMGLLVLGRFCFQQSVLSFLYVAYVGLLGFPLWVWLVQVVFRKKVALDFGKFQKQLFLAFWIWTVLFLISIMLFLSSQTVLLPGVDQFWCPPN